jgi:hypothetical protein
VRDGSDPKKAWIPGVRILRPAPQLPDSAHLKAKYRSQLEEGSPNRQGSPRRAPSEAPQASRGSAARVPQENFGPFRALEMGTCTGKRTASLSPPCGWPLRGGLFGVVFDGDGDCGEWTWNKERIEVHLHFPFSIFLYINAGCQSQRLLWRSRSEEESGARDGPSPSLRTCTAMDTYIYIYIYTHTSIHNVVYC